MSARELSEFQPASTLKQWGWTLVKGITLVPTPWLKENIKGKFTCFNGYWYFELKEDAEWFSLRWK